MTASSSRLSWLDSALCATRLELPWTADAVDVTDAAASEMRDICRCCPVVAACAAAAGEWQVSAGWWAGASPGTDRPVRSCTRDGVGGGDGGPVGAGPARRPARPLGLR